MHGATPWGLRLVILITSGDGRVQCNRDAKNNWGDFRGLGKRAEKGCYLKLRLVQLEVSEPVPLQHLVEGPRCSSGAGKGVPGRDSRSLVE